MSERSSPDIDTLSVLIKQYALDLRRNASGGDDYPWEFAKGVSDYLGELIKRAKGNCTCAQAGFPDSCDNCDAQPSAWIGSAKFDETGMSKHLREIIGQETIPPLWIYVTKEQIPILEAIADRLDWLESLYAPFITEHPPQPTVNALAQVSPSIDGFWHRTAVTLQEENKRLREAAQPSAQSKAEWFCEWLQGYLTPITGHDELDAFDANTIRNTLNETMGSTSPVSSTQDHTP